MRIIDVCLILLLSISFVQGYPYKYKDYSTMVAMMRQLSRLYPELVDFTSVQREYGFQSTLKCGEALCEHWFLRLYNHRIHKSPSKLPQLFLSGELHGNERVAPTAIMELAILLCQNRAHFDSSYKSDAIDSFQEIPPRNFDPYLSYLLDSREIIIMPMTNAQGYYYNRRTENTIDVNRDFPFDFEKPPYLCLRSETAQALQVLYTHNLFLSTITFHAGMQSISYEWGDYFNYRIKARSPDHFAMRDIAESMDRYCGGSYTVGPTNQIVYPVHGGMEEWGYAGSWFNKKNRVATVPAGCQSAKVVTTECSNRCLTFLIETTDVKTPKETALGNNTDIWRLWRTSRQDYVNVIIRQSLVLMDVVLPYSMIQQVLLERQSEVRWLVGGCFEVDDTQLIVLPPLPQLKGLAVSREYEQDLTADEVELVRGIVREHVPIGQSEVLKGVSPLRSSPREGYRLSMRSNQLTFHTQLEIACEECVLIAVSHVDAYMMTSPSNHNPPVSPQSHLAQVHGDDTYVCRDATSGREIRGRHTVFSRPYWVKMEKLVREDGETPFEKSSETPFEKSSETPFEKSEVSTPPPAQLQLRSNTISVGTQEVNDTSVVISTAYSFKHTEYPSTLFLIVFILLDFSILLVYVQTCLWIVCEQTLESEKSKSSSLFPQPSLDIYS